ncbi:DUF4097 domain-containing protein [Virgibacillus byunsanensis]|uniref:DUF4097 domain-containing protein n=1 Tax=Virgibacillus byunsanensis TaxID=570945 RepID=A0ABW3LLP2_9BACI
MNNVKKIAMVALLLVIIGGVGSIITFNINEPIAVAEDKEVENTNITAIDIQANNEQIEIHSTNDSKASIELTGKTKTGEERLSVEENGNTLSIRTEEQKNKLFNFNFWTFSMKLNIYLPEKLYDSIQIDNDNGSITAENLDVTEIDAATQNGKINLNNITAENVQMNTNNGKISLSNVDGEIYGKTNNGAISLITNNLDRPIEFDTDNGKIEIQSEQEPTNAILDVRVDNGRIDICGDSNWDSVIGNGENKIKLTTNNGSITMTK